MPSAFCTPSFTFPSRCAGPGFIETSSDRHGTRFIIAGADSVMRATTKTLPKTNKN
jgi:hypothetical protein